ncbi:MAG: DNA-directed RNA polymerase subunit omega [Negativicoccus succinicivorans]|nr:DNA-directed RNA polymerase subunit omega [Negativicoccus succinicivorans]
MVFPSIDDLLERVDSKYTLVSMVAKRARELTEGAEALVEADAKKPTTIALEEIYYGKVKKAATHPARNIQ